MSTELEIVGLVNSVGFPIAMCLLLFWDRVKTLNKLSEVIQKNTEALKELKARSD